MKLLSNGLTPLLILFTLMVAPVLRAGTNTNVTACSSASLVIDITQQPICPGVEEGEVFAEVVTTGNVSEFVLVWDAAIDPVGQIPSGQPSWDQRAIRLAEGNYIVTASNTVDGCTFATNFTVLARNPDITFDVVPEFDCVVSGQTTCVELENLIGGVDPNLPGTAYLLDWDINGNFFSSDRICGLGPGTYAVIVSGLEPANGNVSTVCTETRQFTINECLSAAPVMDCVDVILDCVGPSIPLPAVTDDNDPAPRVDVLSVTERFEPSFCRVIEVEYRATDFDGGQSFCTRVVRYLDNVGPARARFELEFPDQLATCPAAIITNLPLFRLDLTDNCGLRLERPPIFDCPLDAELDGTAGWSRGVFNNQTGGSIAAPSRFWACQNAVTNSGNFALQAGGFTTSPLLGDNETTFLETQVTGPGDICFAFRVSSERQLLSTSTADFFRFSIGTNVIENVAGEVAWTRVCHSVPAGPVTLRWAYAKDDFLSVGEDGAWIDDVYFQTPNPPPFVQVDRNIISGSGCGTDRQEVDLVYTAEDTCGNQTSFTQRWSIADNSAPVATDFATVFPDQFVGSLAAVTTDLAAFDLLISDNCGIVTSEVIEAAAPVGCSNEVVKIVYRAFDACANEGRYTQTWAIARAVPTFNNLPGDVVVECNDPFPDPVPVTGLDNDGNTVAASSVLRPFQTNCSGRVEFERVYTLNGACGLSSTFSQRITFAPDTTPPEIGLPGLPPPVDGGATCQVEMPDLGAFAVDRCGGNTNVVQSPAAGSILVGDQLLPVTLTATDGCGNSVTVTVAVQIVCDEPANGSIAGVVWQDFANTQDPSGSNLADTGVAGVLMTLYRVISGGTSNLVTSTTTAAGGGYAFGNITPGDYVVVPDASSIPQGAGTLAVSSLSFAIMGQSETANFPLIPGTGPQTRTVEAIVWNDLSVDGDVQNENLAATGLPGVRVTATDVSGAIPPAQFVTDGTGIATLSLTIGTSYLITFDSADIPSFLNRRSTPTDQTITVSLSTPTVLFGVHRTADAVTLSSVDLEFSPPALTWSTSFEEDTLGFYIYQDLGGGNWVRVNNSLVLAAGSGDYSLPLPDALGPYSLREVTTDLNEVELALVDGVGDVVNVELRIENLATPRAPSTGSVSGTVWRDLDVNGSTNENLAEFGLEGIPVSLVVPTSFGTAAVVQVTSSTTNGFYSFPDVPAGSYRVMVDATAFEAALQNPAVQYTTPLLYDFNLAAGEAAGPFDFGGLGVGENFVEVKATVWTDLSADGSPADENLAETGLSGVRLTVFSLSPPMVSLPIRYTTDANGCVVLRLSPGETYRVSIDGSTIPVGLPTPTNQLITVSSATNLNFGVPPLASVEGNVWEDFNLNGLPDENLEVFGLGGALVSLSSLDSNGTPTVVATTISSTNTGLYTFNDVPPGDYNVSVQLLEQIFSIQSTPFEYTIKLGLGDLIDYTDFGVLGVVPFEVTDVKVTVWNDLSADGSVSNESLASTGLQGVRVIATRIAPKPSTNHDKKPGPAIIRPVTVFTDELGCANLRLGSDFTYRIELDETTVPATLNLRSTLTQQTMSPGSAGANPTVSFGVHSNADAVELASIDVEPEAVHWTTVWEENVLGYHLYRRDLNHADKTDWTLVNSALVLAVGGGAYELPLAPSNEESAGPVVFSLRELTINLAESEIARFADASPRGAPVEINPEMADANTLVIPPGAASVLVEPAVKLTDADEPELELLGEILETPDGAGIYFSWPEGRRVRVW